MQDNDDISLQKVIYFFKNKFDIFKNSLIPHAATNTATNATTNTTVNNSITHSSVNITTPINNNPTIYMSSSDNIAPNEVKLCNTGINITTKTTPNINTTTYTRQKSVNCRYINDYSRYTYNIVSSLLSNIVDDIETEDSISNRSKNKNKIYQFYDEQCDYSSLRTILTPCVFEEFQQIINGILFPTPNYLRNLFQIKKYQGDLSTSTIRYGVFETNNFIVKIDDHYTIFVPELLLMSTFGKGIIPTHNIVLPYFVHIKKDNKDTPNAPAHMNFSIQPRIKNTLSLRKWINLLSNRSYSVSYYIQLCITVSKSILFMHSHNIVHGDIKPDNILIELSSNKPYIIDFGMSGLHKISQGTGGTLPFCCPETNNGLNTRNDNYLWIRNNKQNDLWSIAFVFSTIVIFKNSYLYYDDYPLNYFVKDGYINMMFLTRIPLQYREPFILVLSKKSDINLSNFIQLLESSLTSTTLP